MPYSARFTIRHAVAITTPLVSALAACGGGTSDKAKAGADTVATGPICTSRDTTAVGVAVREFITYARPTPQRFLSAAGTDSALPDDGFKVLQDKGPTYFYTSDPKGQAQVREKLEYSGPYASMLVVYRGKTEADNGNTVTVTLGGHYVGGEHDGKVADNRTMVVRCDTTGWRLASPSAAPTAADSAAAGTPTGTVAPKP
ncbi:MAG TPA: hypothetical protein DGD08_15375 [Gemmatimonas aurantiaca]|uniref:DUF4440 domain-containing protein n=2 Tax=Gemmatimonas aurantiaca TaxID=173480 RepID=C1A5P3_GEMAT|nr:hypothetical protein [Gemmatimonas aurantiaca]BAH37553.1 hypothetical protein GAU_0511 [Gemmatimonas aurantiaca T-27]HCT58585.1 hypothetical protein [Gemmatimonas aurantiaca]